MALTEHYYTQFEPGCFYHVYNRSIDKQPLFKNRDNYLFFLKRYGDYLGKVVDTYAYNLLGNHFHLLIRTPLLEELEREIIGETYHDYISKQFRKFFQSYAMAFNKQQKRTGTLFQTPFKRALIDNKEYLKNTIIYIHQNAALHGLVSDFWEWEWSSYNSLLKDKATKLMRDEVINLFGTKNAFEQELKKLISEKDFWDFEG